MRSERGHGDQNRKYQVYGCQQIEMFAGHCDTFNCSVKQSLSVVDSEKYQHLLDFVLGNKNKLRRVELKAKKEQYSKGTDKPHKKTHLEQYHCSANIPAEMDNGLKICSIVKRNIEGVKVEIEYWGIRKSTIDNNRD